ncbi:alpha/beta fold hydrolase [Colwelliaceae bacterium BS250]
MLNFGFHKHPTLSIVASLSAVLMFASANSQAQTAPTNTMTHPTYKNEKAIIFETMGGEKTDAYEGFINVPENRSNKMSRTIAVKYVRFPATGDKNGSPIIYLSGGPGGSGISTAKYPNFRFPLFMAMREFGDVIALDQRGTGISNDTPSCNSSQVLPLNEKLNEQQVSKYYRTAATECLAFWKNEGVDVLGYTTQESVSDIEDLRTHFEAEKITLWGISYGSHLALAAIKTLQNKIDKVVIASAEGLNQTVKLPFATDAYFSRLQQAINTQPEAAKQYPDIAALMHRVHKKLDDNPLPIKVALKDASSLAILFQKTHLQIIASAMIADPQRGVTQLLAIYKSLDQGQDQLIKKMLARGYLNNKPISFNVMAFAMDIASGITDERLIMVNEQAKTSLLGTALNFPMPQLNNVVAGLDLGDDFRAFPVSNVPTLLLTGTLDGRTYINSQNEATQGLSNLSQVTIINGGHNVFMVSPEVTSVIKSFLKEEEIKVTEITIDLPSFALPK